MISVADVLRILRQIFWQLNALRDLAQMKKFTYSAVASALFLATSAYADQNANKEPVEKIEVVGSYIQGYGAHNVSGASKLDLAIIEIPQSVSVISTVQMADYQLTNLNDALDTATGVNVERIETDRTYYTARGFDITNFQADGVGLPLASGNNHGDIDTAMYERIEIIRGANGIMTGVGNPSATVNFIRKRPTTQTQLSATATLGSWGNQRLELDASGALSDSINGRVVIVKHQKDSYLDRYSTDKTLAYGIVEANLTEDTTLMVSHSFSDSDAVGNNWGALPLFYSDGSATNFDTATNTSADWSNWQVTKNDTFIELSHNINNQWNVRATYSHIDTDEDSELFYVYGTPNRDTGLGLTGYGSEYDRDDKHDLFDLYLSGDFSLFGGDHQLVIGGNYDKISYIDTSLYDYTTGNGFPAMPALETWDGNAKMPTFNDGKNGSEIDAKQQAIYASARFNIGEDFHLLTGGRINKWQTEGLAYGKNKATEANEFIPYLGAVYQMTPQIVAYTSYTETFTPQTQRDSNDDLLDPITGESVEVGFKGQFFEDQLITSIAYFDVEQNNVAQLDPSTASLSPEKQRFIGVDGVSSTGYEFEIAGELLPGLQTSIGYTSYSIAGDDKIKAFTPEKILKLAATYTLPQFEQVSMGVSMRWQDDISREQGVVAQEFANAGQTIVTKQDAYALVNLMARYQVTPDISVTVNANNVTDEKYLTSLYWAQGYYGAPASYSATLNWKI